MSEVTVILNLFRRPWALAAQYSAVKNQTVKPTEIMIWQNCGDKEKPFLPLDRQILTQSTSVITNSNFGVWSRFAFALNAKTEYVCIFDDDTIPGNRWLENCLATMGRHEGLLGTNGVIFKDLNYGEYEQFGWASPNESTTQVDIVGHSWFMKREWLGAFWREAIVPNHYLSGEDIHFSYAIQKYLGLNTYVPPHPIGLQNLWGSQPDTGYQLGVDHNAISLNFHSSHFGENLKLYKEKGFKYIEGL